MADHLFNNASPRSTIVCIDNTCVVVFPGNEALLQKMLLMTSPISMATALHSSQLAAAGYPIHIQTGSLPTSMQNPTPGAVALTTLVSSRALNVSTASFIDC